MKSEAFMFTPDGSTKTIYFDDDTLRPKSAIFMVMKDSTNVNSGTGVASKALEPICKNHGGAVSDNTSRCSDWIGTVSILAKDNATTKVSGIVSFNESLGTTGFDTAGQLTMSFTAYDTTYKVFGLVFGD